MSLFVSLVPITRSLVLHEPSDERSHYSLSGTVQLSTSRIFSSLPLLHQARILVNSLDTGSQPVPLSIELTSLVVTFEGYAELLGGILGDQEETYNAARLCSISQELISVTSSVLIPLPSHDGKSDHYQIVFDLLTIPGWLPPSTRRAAKFTEDNEAPLSPTSITSSIKYSLSATASYRVIQSPKSSLSASLSYILQCWAHLGSSSMYTTQSGPVGIEVVRHYVSPSQQLLLCHPPKDQNSSSQFPPVTYLITAKSQPSSLIPDDIISRLQIQVLAPSIISEEEVELPISMAFRLINESRDCSCDNIPNGLAVTHVEVNFEQEEAYSSQPDDAFISKLPLLAPQLSPVPLDFYEVKGHLSRGNHERTKWSNLQSLIREDAPSCFLLDYQNEDDIPGPGHMISEDWSILDIQAILGQPDQGCQSNTCSPSKRHPMSTSFRSPFLSISHSLTLSFHLLYGGDKRDVAKFSLPVQVVRLEPNPFSRQIDTATHYQLLTESSLSSLPPYSKLFYKNGEEKVDDSDSILPAYSRTVDG
ncbi:hypothetical protein CPB86DRAFT_839244 [Serendipita vermifera]|nr:hypothetical protein CPB86DRAFT_839244 [Serendipita vermifera]